MSLEKSIIKLNSSIEDLIKKFEAYEAKKEEYKRNSEKRAEENKMKYTHEDCKNLICEILNEGVNKIEIKKLICSMGYNSLSEMQAGCNYDVFFKKLENLKSCVTPNNLNGDENNG